MLNMARYSYGFQTREVLQRIVLAEQQRIREEQMLWKVGGTILGLCFGIGDGFQLTDLFMGMAGSAIASNAHEVMSHEDRQFLERCQALWLVGHNSPIELAQRLGPARSRILRFVPEWECPMVFSHHQGYRGDFLVPLGNAGALAPGFRDSRNYEVMGRHFDPEDLETLKGQLYPKAEQAIPVVAITSASKAEALELDPCAQSFLAQSQPVHIDIDGNTEIGYKLAIPPQCVF
jgi:hypothetical protein